MKNFQKIYNIELYATVQRFFVWRKLMTVREVIMLPLISVIYLASRSKNKQQLTQKITWQMAHKVHYSHETHNFSMLLLHNFTVFNEPCKQIPLSLLLIIHHKVHVRKISVHKTPITENPKDDLSVCYCYTTAVQPIYYDSLIINPFIT